MEATNISRRERGLPERLNYALGKEESSRVIISGDSSKFQDKKSLRKFVKAVKKGKISIEKIEEEGFGIVKPKN